MGTEILRSQDCLTERVRISPCGRKTYYGSGKGNGNGNFYSSGPNNNNSNPKSNRKPAVRSERPILEQRKRQPEPLVSKRPSSLDDLRGSKSQNLFMEKVTILRRGESLDSLIKSSETAFRKEQNGPYPKMVSKQIMNVDPRSPAAAGKCDVYAGSAFAVSPAPSSLPLPSFSNKKKQVSVDDSATRDLRRLLHLEF